MFSIFDKYVASNGTEKALFMALNIDISRARRNLKHVSSLRSGKQQAKIKDIGDSELASAIHWLGHATVCKVIKQSTNRVEVTEGFSREFLKKGTTNCVGTYQI